MPGPMDSIQRMQQRPSVQLVLGLGAAILTLFLVAVLGAFAVGGDDDEQLTAGTTDTSIDTSGSLGEPVEPGEDPADPGVAAEPGEGPTGSIDAGPATPGSPGRSGASGGSTSPRGGGTGGGGTVSGGGSTAAGDRTGVSKDTVKWGLHAPVTFDGAPLNLAEDPLEGVQVYIKFLNDNGGVNGRKIEYRVADDRYTVEGGKRAANDLVNDYKPFFVSGTLGVDQIFQVAAEARKRGVPYTAAGGSESVFKNIGMFQVAGSYDTHLEKLADFLAAESRKPAGQSIYSGLKKVGVSALDSPYITPSVDSFEAALKRNGMSLVKVVKVQKPTEQTSYATQIQQLKDAGAEIVVPAQDSITTSREVQECVSQRCPWKWSMSNFAHESDTALSLMGGQWVGVRGLAGGCYYINPNEGNPKLCGQLKAAHEQWARVNGEDDWRKDGQGGTAGYQLVHIWLKAMKDIGTDPTREKFRAALLAYEGYTDLVTGPITYKGSKNLSHGYELMVPYEAGTDKWKQLTPGFVDSF